MRPQKVEISYKTIIFTFLFLATVFLLWSIKSILILFFLCFIFMEAINPTVIKLEKLKIPRALAIIIIYLAILIVISFSIAGIIPVLIQQTSALIDAFPNFIQTFNLFGITLDNVDWNSQLKYLESLPGGIAKTAMSLFSNLLQAFVFFVITFYLLLERKNFGRYSFRLLGKDGKEKVLQIIDRLEQRLGTWITAEFFLMTIIGILSFLGYTLIGLEFAVPLAILAGLLEIVPNIGPTVTTTLAAIVGLTVSPITALLAVACGVIIQQLENNFIVPKIMKETVGLNPLITILAIAVGAQLGGVLGAVLAIPIFLTIETIFFVLMAKK